MRWKMPPDIKVYEALGAIGDKRVALDGNSAKVTSSSGNKSYEVVFDGTKNAIGSNDNGSYWQGYLGYPAIAFLMRNGAIKHSDLVSNSLKGIPWKDLNTKFKNDYQKTLAKVVEIAQKNGIKEETLDAEVARIQKQLRGLKLEKLSTSRKPPKGY